jgi:hypothetical protein
MVAQALHWFDIDRFFTEAKRVLKEDGVLAISSYKILEIAPEVDAIIWTFYRKTTGPFWPPERELVETDYKEIKFPFAELPPIRFEMRERWVDSIVEELRALWKNPEQVREIKWPLLLRIVLQKC